MIKKTPTTTTGKIESKLHNNSELTEHGLVVLTFSLAIESCRTSAGKQVPFSALPNTAFLCLLTPINDL